MISKKDLYLILAYILFFFYIILNIFSSNKIEKSKPKSVWLTLHKDDKWSTFFFNYKIKWWTGSSSLELVDTIGLLTLFVNELNYLMSH